MAYGIDTIYDSQSGEKATVSLSKPAISDGDAVMWKDGEFRVGGVKYYELKSTAPEESIIIEQLDIKAFQYGKIVSIHFNTSGKILKPSTWIEIATLPKELTPAYPVILNYPIQTLGNIMLLHITSEQAIRIFMSSGEAMTDSRRIIGQHVMYIAKY